MSRCPADVSGALDVSRETLECLEQYVTLLKAWNSKINLVAPSTINAVWTRHILDSAQIYLIGRGLGRNWVDVGSGGGFPGLVVAIMAKANEAVDVTLVESDQRKAAFLRTVLRECALNARVIAKRIESVPPLNASVISARALAPLDQLLGYCERHLRRDGAAVFLKGAKAAEEVATARNTWSFRCESFASKTDAEASVLKIGDIERV